MIDRIQLIWGWLPNIFTRKEPAYTLVNLEEMPEEPAILPHRIYHIGAEGHKWCLAMLCPCGCGSIIYLNMLPGSKPSWHIETESKEKFSIWPSINRQVGCLSHFFIRQGRVIFVYRARGN